MTEAISSRLRFAMRALARSPGFAATMVLTLAIAVGATTAVFSVLYNVSLEPLPYPDSDELVSIWHSAPGAPGLGDVSGGLLTSASMYFTYAEENRTFEEIGLWSVGSTSVTGLAEPEQVGTAFVTDGTLQALGVRPVLGRWLDEADQDPSGASRLMLGYDYWQRRFGGEESVLGRTITVNAQPVEIVGVMPEGFRIVDTDAEMILPFRFDRSTLRLPTFDFRGIARLGTGVTIGEASADIARMIPIWAESWPPFPGADPNVYEEIWRIAPALRPLKDDVLGNVGNVLWVVMAMIFMVLMIACANVTNLQLVRAEGRRREFAVRAAIGASSSRIARTLLSESALLGLVAGALGIGLAYTAVELLVASQPAGIPRLSEIALGRETIVFALIVSLAAGLLSGSMPAFRLARATRSTALNADARAGSSRERYRAQNALVVAQVALALVLLVGSGLMIRTFQALGSIEAGFTDPEELQTVRISIPALLEADPERVIRMQNEIVDRLSAVAGVVSAGFSSSMPMEGLDMAWDVIQVEGREQAENGAAPPIRRFKFVSPGLFETLGTRFVAGRDISWTEVHQRRPVVLVSENLARELWTNPATALGKRIRLGADTPWREIVGVVQDIRDNGLSEPAPTIVYWPSILENASPAFPLTVRRAVTVALRSELAGTEGLLRQVQLAVWSVNSNLPVASVRTMKEIYDRSLVRTTFTLALLAAAGAIALVLGVVGLYGVLSYVVAQRRREIAIRLSLGAQQGELVQRYLRFGITLSTVGVLIGLGVAAGVTRFMSSLLFGIRPLDPITYAIVAVALTLVAALASYLPARRASKVQPAEALAAEG